MAWGGSTGEKPNLAMAHLVGWEVWRKAVVGRYPNDVVWWKQRKRRCSVGDSQPEFVGAMIPLKSSGRREFTVAAVILRVLEEDQIKGFFVFFLRFLHCLSLFFGK